MKTQLEKTGVLQFNVKIKMSMSEKDDGTTDKINCLVNMDTFEIYGDPELIFEED